MQYNLEEFIDKKDLPPLTQLVLDQLQSGERSTLSVTSSRYAAKKSGDTVKAANLGLALALFRLLKNG